MKTGVIPNGVRDLTTGEGSHKFIRVLRASWARSLALLGMTEKCEGSSVGGKMSVTE